MRDPNHGLLTPILIKDREDLAWPRGESVFYVLSRSGLFLCRQNDMFRSCVPVERGPSELASQSEFLEHSYPVVPAAVFADLVGFFGAMAERHGCEAGAYLVFDRTAASVRALVPTQRATMYRGASGARYARGLDYDPPAGLGPRELVYGTVHSHVWSAAYASGIDQHDEVDKPGVHIVVGCLDREPPDLHADAVVDGHRFRLEPMQVIEACVARNRDFPTAWMERVEVVVDEPKWYGASGYGYDSPADTYRAADARPSREGR